MGSLTCALPTGTQAQRSDVFQHAEKMVSRTYFSHSALAWAIPCRIGGIGYSPRLWWGPLLIRTGHRQNAGIQVHGTGGWGGGGVEDATMLSQQRLVGVVPWSWIQWASKWVRGHSQSVMHICQVCFKANRMQSSVYLAVVAAGGQPIAQPLPMGEPLECLPLVGNVLLGEGMMEVHRKLGDLWLNHTQ